MLFVVYCTSGDDPKKHLGEHGMLLERYATVEPVSNDKWRCVVDVQTLADLVAIAVKQRTILNGSHNVDDLAYESRHFGLEVANRLATLPWLEFYDDYRE